MNAATVLNIPVDLIDTAAQVRTHFKEDTIAELAADIQAHGVLQPLVVQQNGQRFTLLIGERRLRAIRYLGDPTAPAILASVSAALAGEVQLMENIQREDLNTKDLAAAIKQLWDKHGSVTEVSRRVHKSVSWVSKRLALALDLGPATLAVLDGNVKDVELIYQFKKLEKLDPKKALEIVPFVIDGTIGREEINDCILGDDTDAAPLIPAANDADPDADEINPTAADAPDDENPIYVRLLAAQYALGEARKALEAITLLRDGHASQQAKTMRTIAQEALTATVIL